MSELKAWKFCPECGCREYIQENHLGEHSRVCKDCGQEWWTDINYWNTRPNDAKKINIKEWVDDNCDIWALDSHADVTELLEEFYAEVCKQSSEGDK